MIMSAKKEYRGIDISYHQGKINFVQVKESGIDFVIPREGYGKNTDKKFFEYASGFKEVDMWIPAIYHFSYALNVADPIAEAQLAVKNVQKAGLDPSTVIFYDYEYDTVTSARKKGVILTSKHCVEFTNAFCKEVVRLGYREGVYANIDYYKNIYRKTLPKDSVFWLADYKGAPDFECAIQQYTSSGSVLGISGKVDRNLLFGEKFIIKEIPKGQETHEQMVERIARSVIDGKWGNGVARKMNLEKAGYNYREIQNKVNDLLK